MGKGKLFQKGALFIYINTKNPKPISMANYKLWNADKFPVRAGKSVIDWDFTSTRKK